jgi:hypothetical protein
MTSPARDPEPVPRPSTARWLNAVTTLLLSTVAVIVLAAAGPSILRAGLHASDPPEDPAPPFRAPRPLLVPRDHPAPRSFVLDPDEGDDIDEAPGTRGVRPRSGDPRSAPPRLPGNDDDGPGFGLGLRGGVTVRPLLLRDRRSGSVLHEVRAGQSVSILREDGDWVLLVQKTDDDIVTGWAKRSELLLR